jgi:L-aminopeptidase/D-esterase-like protein
MSLLTEKNKTLATILTVFTLVGGSVGAFAFTIAQAQEAARTEVKATLNKEMVDGAKQAAKDAVKEVLPDAVKQAAEAAAKEAAREAVKQYVESQKPK